MESNAIQVAIRVRPLTAHEASRIPEQATEDLFLGDGHLASARSPATARTLGGAGGGSGGLGLLQTGGMWREVVDVVDHRTLIFDKPDTNATRAFVNGAKAPPGGRKYRDQRYAFDRVFDKSVTQEDVFDHTAKPLLPGLFNGYNATVFAYGATGCGKTHTVSGTKEDPGIIYRTMRELFAQVDESREQWDTQVTVSFLEIYNELIRDLLSEDFPVCPRGGLSLREDEKNRISVAGLSLKQPKSAEEVLEYVLLGNSRRTSSPTHANAESSRSHAVLQVNISRRPKGGDTVDLENEIVSTSVSSATLSIIDLAGSERASATQNMGNRMKEGANINKSLLALGNCINALCVAATHGARQPHIPYRNSKLTRLLKFSLGGNCRTVMIVCVSPCSVHIEDTGNTLKYANRAKNIVTKVSRNVNGVQRNITQYLAAIAEKDTTIKQLEAKLAEKAGASTAAKDRTRAEMGQLKAEMKHKTASYLGALVDGAEARAALDAADLRTSHLRNRMAETSSTAEKEFLGSFLRREETLHVSDQETTLRLQTASKQSSFFDALLRSMQERRFTNVDAVEVEGVRLEAKLRRTEMDLAMAQAKEKSYRGAISGQGEMFGLLVGALVRSTVAMKESRDPALEGLAAENDATFEKLVGFKTSSVPDYKAPPTPVSKPPSFGAARRPSVASVSSTPPIPITKPSLAIRKIFGGTAVRIASPKRYQNSPSRRRPTAIRLKPATVKKTLRWRDETGDGRIADARTDSDRTGDFSLTSDDANEPLPSTPDVEEDEWVDDQPSEPSIREEDDISSPTKNAVPAWKLNRLAIGRTLAPQSDDSSLTSIGSSSPESKRAARPAGSRFMGPPARPTFKTDTVPQTSAVRPGALQPSRENNLRTSVSMSSMRPGMTNMGPPTRPSGMKPPVPTPMKIAAALPASATASRRLSSIGPVRSEKKRSRPSAVLPTLNENAPPSAAVGSRRLSSATASHSRMVLGPAASAKISLSTITSPSKASRRSSIRPTRPSVVGTSAASPPASSTTSMTSSSSSHSAAPPLLRAAMPTASSAAKMVNPSVRRVSSVGTNLSGRPSITSTYNPSALSSIGESNCTVTAGPTRPPSMRSLNMLTGGV